MGSLLKAILAVEIASLLAVGCANSPSVDAYDRSCSADSDCVVVASGDVCDCTCERSAVNRAASAAYQSEFDKNRDRCPGCNPHCYPRCPPNTARCTSGKCVTAPTTVDGGPSDFCQPKGTPCIYDGGAWIPDGFSFKCKSLDAYESSLCDTNLPCVSVADCPTFAPVKCPGTWQCASATCKYKCPP